MHSCQYELLALTKYQIDLFEIPTRQTNIILQAAARAIPTATRPTPRGGPVLTRHPAAIHGRATAWAATTVLRARVRLIDSRNHT